MSDDPKKPDEGASESQEESTAKVNEAESIVVDVEPAVFTLRALEAMAVEVAEDEEATDEAGEEAARHRTFWGLTTSA